MQEYGVRETLDAQHVAKIGELVLSIPHAGPITDEDPGGRKPTEYRK